MIYCWNDGWYNKLKEQGKEVSLEVPGGVERVTDANGLDWTDNKVIWLDTETGEIALMDEDRLGRNISLQVKIEKTAAPIRVEFKR